MPVIYACFINARFKNEISMMASCFTESKVKMIYMFLNDNMLLVLLMITGVCVNHIATLDISCCYSYIFYNIHCQIIDLIAQVFQLNLLSECITNFVCELFQIRSIVF